MEIKKQFGETVRKFRNKKWFSQEEFARKCWVHRTYMWLIERWETNITLENIDKIAKALEINIKDLLS